MKFKRNNVGILRLPVCMAFFSILFFLLDTVGFDFYAHATSYYHYSQAINPSITLYNEIFPRYLLLSYMYILFSYVGIPAGYLAIFLLAYPVYVITNATRNSSKPIIAITIVAILYLSLFYSAFSISIIWFIAFLSSKRNFFLIGSLFSPFGLVIYLTQAVFFEKKMVLLKLIFVLLVFFILNKITVLSNFSGLSYENIQYSFDGNFVGILEILSKKGFQLILVFIIVLTFYFFNNTRLNLTNSRLNFLTASSICFSIWVFFFTLFIVVMLRDTPINLYLSPFESNISNTINIAWFDFFSKDVDFTSEEFLDERKELKEIF